MVCITCGTRLIIENNDAFVCPKCKNITFLPKDEAMKVVNAQIKWFDDAFKQVLGKFDKRRLLVWLCGLREKMSTDFFTVAPIIELNKFLAVNMLIKRVMDDYELSGNEEANDKNTPEIINTFSGFINVIERLYLIEEDFGHYIAIKEYDLNKIDMITLMSNFKFRINEEYVPIADSFEDNLIMNKELANKYVSKNKDKYDAILKSKPNPEERTIEETIKMLFPILFSFFYGLKRNKIYASNLDLKYLKDAGISPKFILDFIKFFEQGTGLMTKTTPKQFKDIIRKKFKSVDKNTIYNNMVFTFENRGIFPFFLNVDNNLFISHNFIRIMGLFYYPFYYTDLFNKTIQNNSDYFEKTLVPKRLYDCGFKVILNYTDKKNASLEIDQIAWKGDTLYVIETKVWDIKPFFEHRKIHGQRERDLKGVVDGKKYSYVHGNEEIKDIPSLIEKINHVKEKLNDICEDYASIKKIIGVVITKSHPIINEYKNVKFLGFEKINTL